MLGNIKRIAGRFLRDARGGATSIASAGVVVMTVSGGALVFDHSQIVGQRDSLKGAADAASLAATLQLNRMPSSLSQQEIENRIGAFSRKYGILNVLANTTDPDATADDIVVTFDIDHSLQVVSASISSKSSATLLSNWLHGYSGPGEVVARSGVEGLETKVELVLAIDQSDSMKFDVNGTDVGPTHPTSRMSIVKQAAIELVNTLRPQAGGNIAIGVVPWDLMVRLDSGMRGTWTSSNWAEYPRSRHYAATFQCTPAGSCTPPAEDNNLPATSPTWEGCLDLHRVSGGRANIAAESLWFEHPGDLAFAQSIFPAQYGRSYDCLTAPAPSNLQVHHCYGRNNDHLASVVDNIGPQRCARKRAMFPLSTDQTAIIASINGLAPAGDATNSGLGLLWAQRLLSSDWRDVWGDPTYPLDEGDDVRKAIVLLTDGDDTQCGRHDPDCSNSDLGHSRASICTAVKAAGTEIFVVGAIRPDDLTGELATQLTACSSQGARAGTYAFVGSAHTEAIHAAFAAIARQLRSVRRLY